MTKANGDILERLPAGTYNVVATIKTLANDKADSSANYVTKTVANSFVVKDSTPAGTPSLEEDTVTAGTIEAMVQAAVKYSYGETSYGKNGDNALVLLSVEGTSNGATVKITKDNYDSVSLSAGQIVNVSKIVVKVQVGTSGVYVTQEANVAYKITAK